MNTQVTQTINKDLLTLEQVEQLSMTEGLQLFANHINPNLAKMYSLLGLADRKPVKAEGLDILMEDGSSVLDLTSAITVLNCGHNHPRIMAARKQWADNNKLELWKFIPSPYQAALAKNLSVVFPGDLQYVFYSNSGAEANEGALKMALKKAGPNRRKVVYTDISFHGKTLGTLSVSGSEKSNNQHFSLLDNCLEIPYGNADALEAIIKEHKKTLGKSAIGTFIVEAIRSEGVVVPPKGYLKAARKICDKYDVTLIIDEVFCGFGRTGKMWGFDHEGIVPDIATFSKAFGAGKASFGGFIANEKLFKKAYGKLNHATMHSTTYNGLGEEVVTAIETLNVMQDEGLVANSEKMGRYFLDQLERIKSKHPNIVKDVRGVGLLINIELENLANKLTKHLPLGLPNEMIAKVTTGGVIGQLYQKHNVMVYAPLHDNNLIMITPPLTINKAQIDRFITALDDVLTTNLSENLLDFVKRSLKSSV